MFRHIATRFLSSMLFAGVVALILLVIHPVFLGESVSILKLEIRALSNQEIVSLIVVLGVSASVLLSYVIYLLTADKKRAESIAKQKTRELAVDRGHLLKLYDQSPVPYLTLLPNGNIHNPNLAALRLFKVKIGGLEGRQFFKMQPDEDHENARALFARFHSGVPVNAEEIRIVREDGAVRWIMLSIFLFREHGKTQRRGLATLVDITDQKELDQAKTEFVSLAGHQLRTPLSTVKWHTEVLLSDKHGSLNEKQKEYVQKVRRGNQTMVDLVDLLLNVSRIEMGTLPIDIKEVNMKAMIEDVLEELAPQTQEKSLVIDTHYDDHHSVIKSDTRLLRIVVQNLLSNAVKYTPENGEVKINLVEKEGKHAFVVTDTGYGIPKEQQEKIFTKMFRADNVRKKGVDGNGLGLYLVKSIVEKLGGSIGFTSVVDKGTTFTVLLP